MAKHLRYMGEFLSRAGVVWRVEILQEADEAFAKIGSLDFDADDALVIEWGEGAKEQVICGSTATLKVISPGDRTYEDLYTIAAGNIRMDVYRDSALYWGGMLDPEFYEEPYEKASGYTVALTFSDFGILDRLKYDRSGLCSVYDTVCLCVGRAGINAVTDRGLISTSLIPGGDKLDLTEILVRGENFYDEDGEAFTLREVLEGVLQPLALRITQRAGRVYVYDLNALYNSTPVTEAVWDGDSQTMGVDRVYNNVKVTWSPYAQKDNINREECWELPTDPDISALRKPEGLKHGEATLFSYLQSPDPADWVGSDSPGFTIWLSDKGKNAEIVHNAAKFYKIVPQFDGSESEGIAVKWPYMHLYGVGTGGEGDDAIAAAYVRHVSHGMDAADVFVSNRGNGGGTIFKTTPVDIPPADETGKLAIWVKMELLADYRFNPFEELSKYIFLGTPYDLSPPSLAQWEASWKANGNFLYVPVAIRFQPNGSDTVYRWDNRSALSADTRNKPTRTLSKTYGVWIQDDPRNNATGYLSYYDVNDREGTSAIGGWRTNRPGINPHTASLEIALQKADDGQPLPYPPAGKSGGKMWVEVLWGTWRAAKGGTRLTDPQYYALGGKNTWILCKLPEIKICNNTLFSREISNDDVEYSAQINADAKEDLEIDTVCGTSAEGVPAARGAYISASDGKQVRTMCRAGRVSQAEDLLIGTMFSQYARRHTTLSGEMRIASGGLSVYTEANQDAKKFLLSADTQNLIKDTSEAVLTELSPDEYKKNNES